jgi:hypothetical protein
MTWTPRPIVAVDTTARQRVRSGASARPYPSLSIARAADTPASRLGDTLIGWVTPHRVAEWLDRFEWGRPRAR